MKKPETEVKDKQAPVPGDDLAQFPGPLVAVMDFNPVREAPTIAHMEAISSSI